MGDLFLVGRADIFAIYPNIFRDLIQVEENARSNTKDGVLPKDFLYLPSDLEFQERVYYRLLEVQKEINQLIDSGMPAEEIAAKREKPIWDPSVIAYRISPIISPASGSSLKGKKCVADDPLSFLNIDDLNVWRVEDVTKAGKLLRKPPIPCSFFDEHEMRRVYSMIYNVFRYKHVLNQALHDVGFFAHYPELQKDQSRIWLTLYDLHLRHFLKREPQEWKKQKYLFKEADLNLIDEIIWKEKISLAASMSRLRIKNSALHLSELLPFHLQEEKVAIAAANPIITGWINPCRMRTKLGAKQCMILNGFLESEETDDGQIPLVQNYFKWDKVCPLFLSCIPPDRNIFSQSELLLNNQFILQNRAFSLGPALCSRLLDYFEIEGDIVQTQITSPRSTAYLAALFQCNNRVNNFIVFGAGPRRNEYRQFMSELGLKNILIYAENFCNINLESTVLDKVVGIFATPSNSYSGVTDPIDLICSRGGDLTMLEVLTESEMSDKGKQRVAQVLEEQRETLRLSMSRPQVQFVLYETHSVVDSENDDMVKYAVDNINKAAQSKHIKLFKEKKRLEAIAEQEGISMEQWEKLQGISSTATTSKRKLKQAEEIVVARKYICDTESSANSDNESDTELQDTSSRSHLSRTTTLTSSDDYYHIKIPKTDLFEIARIPDICLFQDKCLNCKEHGCFMSLMKRKHVTRLDEKYLILMAERRGLFGNTSPKSKMKARSTTTKMTKTKEESRKPTTTSNKVKRKKSDDISILIDRLSQPTYSSIIRSQKLFKSSADNAMLVFTPSECTCEREQEKFLSQKRFHRSSTSTSKYSHRAKNWWIDTTQFIKSIKSDKNKNTFYDDIKNEKLPPLKLDRINRIQQNNNSMPNAINRMSPLKSWPILNRDIYPVSTNYVEFQEYRTPKLNFANVPFMIEENYSEYVRQASRHTTENPFKTLGYPSLRTSYSRP